MFGDLRVAQRLWSAAGSVSRLHSSMLHSVPYSEYFCESDPYICSLPHDSIEELEPDVSRYVLPVSGASAYYE